MGENYEAPFLNLFPLIVMILTSVFDSLKLSGLFGYLFVVCFFPWNFAHWYITCPDLSLSTVMIHTCVFNCLKLFGFFVCLLACSWLFSPFFLETLHITTLHT